MLVLGEPKPVGFPRILMLCELLNAGMTKAFLCIFSLLFPVLVCFGSE